MFQLNITMLQRTGSVAVKYDIVAKHCYIVLVKYDIVAKSRYRVSVRYNNVANKLFSKVLEIQM